MDSGYLFKAILALVLVLSLISLLAWVLKRYGMATLTHSSSRVMQLVDTLYLDNTRRMVCVRRGGKYYLVLLGHKEIIMDTWEDESGNAN